MQNHTDLAKTQGIRSAKLASSASSKAWIFWLSGRSMTAGTAVTISLFLYTKGVFKYLLKFSPKVFMLGVLVVLIGKGEVFISNASCLDLTFLLHTKSPVLPYPLSY